MYEQHWQLHARPFENNVSTDFYFRSRSHQAAMLKMRYVVDNDLGCGMLISPVGCGKSYTVCMLNAELAENGPFVHVLFPQMSANEMLSYIANGLAEGGTAISAQDGLHRIAMELDQQMVRLARLGLKPVVVVEDAHLIDDPSVFSALAQLLNYASYEDRALTILLTGQPSLQARIQRTRGLDDRIAARSVLMPLSFEETEEYVDFRMKTAGALRQIFDSSAMQSLFEQSGGIPRRINRLCEMALLVGFAEQLDVISGNEISAVAEELAPIAA